jgi:hypothetical protein
MRRGKKRRSKESEEKEKLDVMVVMENESGPDIRDGNRVHDQQYKLQFQRSRQHLGHSQARGGTGALRNQHTHYAHIVMVV